MLPSPETEDKVKNDDVLISPPGIETKLGVTVSKKVTLGEFIETNHKLLSTLGIFTVLAVFSNNLQLKGIGYFLSFLFVAAMVLIWLELWARFPTKGSEKLVWFENIISVATLGVVVYWLVDFRSIWRYYLPMLILLILLWPMSEIMRRFNIFNVVFHTKPGERKTLRYILGLLILMVAFIISGRIAGLLAPPINALLDEIYREALASAGP